MFFLWKKEGLWRQVVSETDRYLTTQLSYELVQTTLGYCIEH